MGGVTTTDMKFINRSKIFHLEAVGILACSNKGVQERRFQIPVSIVGIYFMGTCVGWMHGS